MAAPRENQRAGGTAGSTQSREPAPQDSNGCRIAIPKTYRRASRGCVRPSRSRTERASPYIIGLAEAKAFLTAQANALAELGLPSGALAVALASFHLGVEAGQLAIVSVLLPAAYWCRNRWLYPRLVLGAGSCAIAVIASIRLIERVLNVSIFPALRFALVLGPAFWG